MKTKMKTKFKIGIIFRDGKIVFTKAESGLNNYCICAYIFFPFKESLTYFENLDSALSKIPLSFFRNSEINFLLPSEHLQYQNAQFPLLNKKEFKIALQNQLEDVSVYYWDYLKICTIKLKAELPSTEEEENAENRNLLRNKVVIVKAEKKIIEHYIDIFDRHKVYVNNVLSDLNIIHNVFSLKLATEQQVKGNKLLLDLDESSMKIYIFEDNKLFFDRHVQCGYAELRAAMCKKVQLKNKEVEFDAAEVEKVFKTKNIFLDTEDVKPLFFLARPVLEKMAIEIQKSMHFHSKQMTEKVVFNDIYLMGDFNKITDIEIFFKNQLNMDVRFFTVKSQIFEKTKNKLDKLQEDKLLMSGVVSLGGVASKEHKFTLLPSFYVLKKQRRLLIKIILLCFIGWSFFAGLLVTIYSTYNNYLEKEIVKNERVLKTLVTKRNELKGQKSLEKLKVQAFQFMEKINKDKKPLENLFYFLNQLDIKEVFLTSINIDKTNNFVLEGKVLGSKAQLLVTDYIDRLSKAPYCKNLNFQIEKATDNKYASFVIRAQLK